tara:strand:- start:30117 stop:31916 length:1800 start_codon:yes stop_codon:yes gene_type:complete
MCGYIGAVSFNQIDINRLVKDNEKIICRGPDEKVIDYGNFGKFNNYSNLNFGFIFNRLAIVDLSSKASQPMYSKKFNTLIMFNGEIYNHKELRRELESKGVHFNSNNSDTEVILNGLSKYGLKFIDSIIGQFSIVFFDFRCDNILLIRDRMGQKPLFYKFDNHTISFSSNLKSLSSFTRSTAINTEALSEYINYGVVPSPNTILENIYKVKPGEVVQINTSNSKMNLNKELYWKIDDYVGSEIFERKEFINLFNDSVNIRKEADVEVASLLSGGIDSTSIVKALSEGKDNINTFSIGYQDPKYDESHWSKLVAEKYRTNHINEILTKPELDKYINESLNIYDEPYSDPSTVPSYVVSKLISRYYKVAITGDGGDELLGGYDRVQQILNYKKFNSKIIESVFKAYPSGFGTGNVIASRSKNLEFNYSSYFSDKKLLSLLEINDNFKFEENFMNSNHEGIKRFLITDYKFFLSEMMMLKVDRTSMHNSVEARSPFVDHRLVEYCIGKNLDFLEGKSKIILKEYLNPDFSIQFTERPKMGFVFNLESWIYENLENISDQINDGKISEMFNMSNFRSINHRKSRINAQRIWKLLTLENFLQDI